MYMYMYLLCVSIATANLSQTKRAVNIQKSAIASHSCTTTTHTLPLSPLVWWETETPLFNEGFGGYTLLVPISLHHTT